MQGGTKMGNGKSIFVHQRPDSEIYCSYLPYVRPLPLVLRNTCAHEGIVYPRYPVVTVEAKERENLRMIAPWIGRRPSRQSFRKFHCRWKNQDYDRTRSLPPLLRPRAPDAADSLSFRRQRRRRGETTQVIVRKYDGTRSARLNKRFDCAQTVTWTYWNIDIRSHIFIRDGTRREEYIYNSRNSIHKIALLYLPLNFIKSPSLCSLSVQNMMSLRIPNAVARDTSLGKLQNWISRLKSICSIELRPV